MIDQLPEQELLKIVTEHARVGLVVVSTERRYVYANVTYSEILDLPTSGICGQRVADVLAGVYEDQVSPRLDRAFSGERVNYELRKPMMGGDRYYSVRYEPKKVDGAVALVVVVVVDITEHRQTQADSSRFVALMESSDDAIIGVALNGKVNSWNAGAERLFGYSSAEILGTPIKRIIPPDCHGTELHIRERIKRGELVQNFETRRQTKAGKVLAVSLTVSPIKDASGQVIGVSKIARDISEQKRIDEERRFHQTMLLTERELTLDGIFVMDEYGKVCSYNARLGLMWGIAPDVLATGADAALFQAVHDKVRHPERFIERVRELHDRHGDASHDEVELTDGRVFERSSAPMRTAEGRYYGRVWYFRDVTERKQALVELRRERDRAQRYLDTAGVILLALDLSGRITLVNRYACTVFGWTAEELIGRDFIDACVPAWKRHATREKLRTSQLGDDAVTANEIVTRTGDVRLIQWRTTFLRDDAGAITGTLSSGSDITEQRRAELALRTERDRAQRYLDTVDVILLVMDVEGRISLINRKGCELLGWTEAELLGRSWISTCVPARIREALTQKFDNLVGGDLSSVESPILTRSGKERLIEWRNRLLRDDAGRVIGTLSSGTDVTDRRMLEERYYQAQKMDAIGRLAGGVAHDFNNLLTVILGYCQLLLTEFHEQDPLRQDILEINVAGESAARLTRQLLAFSRKQLIEPTLLDLKEVISNLRGMLGRIIGEDVEIVLNLRSGVAPVRADSGQMEQIVVNLAVNSRDAMPNGGTLTIETANVELDEHYISTHFAVKPGAYVALTVSDTGVGIPPEVQARLFEPFFTTKAVGKGTGLGLATVHGIVTRCGGSISVYSEVGKGTSFTLYLPQAAADDIAPEPRTPAVQSCGAGEAVLVVEDAEGLRDLTKRLLERLGYTVFLAANASEAMEQCERHRGIDVILSDVVLPGGSGPELTRRLLSLRPALKVIYMSGYTEDAITHQGVLAPGIAFLHKPFTVDSLGRKLREVLAR